MQLEEPFHPLTAADALARWDRGDCLSSIEMGGLGPGYEQAIQVGTMELIRDMLREQFVVPAEGGDEAVSKAAWEQLQERLMVLERRYDWGLSGAQAGAIKTLAWRYVRDGWEATLASMRKHDTDRIISISRHWPKTPDASNA